MSRSIAILVLVLCVSTFSEKVDAREIGWFNGTEWSRIYKELLQTDEYPIRMQCRDSYNKELNRDSGVSKITVKKKPANIDWAWAYGDWITFNSWKRRHESNGYKLALYSEYRRTKSKLLIRCAIWYRTKQ